MYHHINSFIFISLTKKHLRSRPSCRPARQGLTPSIKCYSAALGSARSAQQAAQWLREPRRSLVLDFLELALVTFWIDITRNWEVFLVLICFINVSVWNSCVAQWTEEFNPPVTWGLKVAVGFGDTHGAYQRYQIRSHPAWRTFCQSTKVQGPRC